MKALIVVDMLKDFINEDGALYCGDEARKIIPFIKKRIDDVRAEENVVIFLKDTHSIDDAEFDMFPPHCVEGTAGAEIIDELKVKENDIIIPKSRYSGFYGTNLEQVLLDKKVNDVEIVGVCTSICVMDTVGDLRNRDYAVSVLEEGVADFDSEAHRFSLIRMKKTYGAKIV